MLHESMSEIIMCLSSFSHYMHFEVCEFPIARHTHAKCCDTMEPCRKVRGQGLAQDHAHGLVPDHGLHGAGNSGYLF